MSHIRHDFQELLLGCASFQELTRTGPSLTTLRMFLPVYSTTESKLEQDPDHEIEKQSKFCVSALVFFVITFKETHRCPVCNECWPHGTCWPPMNVNISSSSFLLRTLAVSLLCVHILSSFKHSNFCPCGYASALFKFSP